MKWAAFVFAVCFSGPLFAAADVPVGKLEKGDRARLAAARVIGNTDVTLVIAATPGSNARLVKELETRGARIRYREDAIDYVRAQAPIERVEDIARLDRIEALDVDESTHVQVAASEQDAVNGTASLSPPGPNTPAANPYMPTVYMGAPQFLARHPTFDGRAVVMAVIDFFPDIRIPELQSATTLDGRPARKILDIVNPGDPIKYERVVSGQYDAVRVRMAEEVTAVDGRFSFDGVTYLAPVDGVYRFGVHVQGKRQWVVLWNEKTNDVWVDTNNDASLRDEPRMTDYRVRYDTASLSRGGTVFTVQTHPPADGFLTINLMNQSHGTISASVAAGKGLFGSAAGSAAPEAQLVLVRSGYTFLHSLIEGFVVAAAHPAVDLVTAQVAIDDPLNDDASTFGIIVHRLIAKYDKPILISVSNSGPALNTVSALASTSGTIGVGSYVHRETWKVGNGIAADRADYVATLSARGPSEAGAFKPDVLAPVGGIYPETAARRSNVDSASVRALAPAGYNAGSLGTSFAAPIAAGAVAALISAAKQSGIPYDAASLRQAILSGARYLPDYGVHEQGTGLVDVSAAWDVLKRLPAPVAISARAPVSTVLSERLRTPNHGSGLYEREGWRVGQRATRRIELTRSSGPAEPIRYQLRWKGNDGTFSLVGATTLTLPLNKSVEVPLMVHPRKTGVHSAVLELTDREGGQVVHRVMNTVIAAETFSPRNGFAVRREGEAKWLGHASFFLDVPRDVAALKVAAQVRQGRARLRTIDPTGGGTGGGRTAYQTGETLSSVIAQPRPGVWEVIVENADMERTEEDVSPETELLARPTAKFALSASVFRTSPQMASARTLPNATSSQQKDNATQEIEVSFNNALASLHGGIEQTPLGSALALKPMLVAGDVPRSYDIDVPAGTERLHVALKNASDPKSDLDLYLFDMTRSVERNPQGPVPVPDRASTGEGSDESVTVYHPSPGRWRVMIDPVAIPSGKTTVEYLELFTHADFGSVEAGGQAKQHQTGSAWRERVSVNVRTRPAEGRYLAAVVEVTAQDITMGPSRQPRSKGDRMSPSEPAPWHVPLGGAIVSLD